MHLQWYIVGNQPNIPTEVGNVMKFLYRARSAGEPENKFIQ